MINGRCAKGIHNLNSVVVARLQNNHVIAVNQVHEPVLIGDPPRPSTLRTVFKLLGLAYPAEGIAEASIYQCINPLKDPAISLLPVLVVLPSRLVPCQAHLLVPIKFVGLDPPRGGPLIGV